MRTLISTFLLATSFLCLSMTAFAKPATDATINKLLRVDQSEQQSKQLILHLPQLIQTQSEQIIKDKLAIKTLNSKQKRVVQELSKFMLPIYQKELSWNKLHPLLVNLYKKNYTEEEINMIIEWYSSDTGRSILKKMPQFFGATEQLGRQMAMQAVNNPQYIQQMRKILEKLN